MSRFFWSFFMIVFLFSSCKKDPEIPCMKSSSDALTAGHIPENTCGILQKLNQEVPNPERGETTKLNLDVNLDGVMDFELTATLSYSPSHYRPGLLIRSLNDQASFGLFRQDFSICYLVFGPPDGKVIQDCRKNCSDFLPEELPDYKDTLFYNGQIRFVEGLEEGTLFDDNLYWEQALTPFTKSKPNPGAKDCTSEVIGVNDKWTSDATLYLPIKLLSDQGTTLLGWIKCKHDGRKNPLYETYIQTE